MEDNDKIIYKINESSSNSLAKEFDFNEYDEEYIRLNFWPIITLSEIDLKNFKEKILKLKEEFINVYEEFDINIFKREHLEFLEFLEYELKIYLSSIQRGKYNEWDLKKDKYFYHLKLDSEINTPRHQTLLITEKDKIQLELYFKKIIEFIESFIAENSKIELNQVQATSNIDEVITKNIDNKFLNEDLLDKIWLLNAKISIENLIKLGIRDRIWDESCNLLTKRNSLYGSGKSLLGSLSVVLKKHSISQETDYKIIGEAFCKKFNITINTNVKDPYKAFGTGNSKIIKELERWLKQNS